MSTSAEIGRSPTAASRSCSQAGLGPLRTPRKHAADEQRAGRAVASREIQADLRAAHRMRPAPARKSRGFSVPSPAAASSRAMPSTPKQSLRLGVTATSITGPSSRITSLAGAPTGASRAAR